MYLYHLYPLIFHLCLGPRISAILNLRERILTWRFISWNLYLAWCEMRESSTKRVDGDVRRGRCLSWPLFHWRTEVMTLHPSHSILLGQSMPRSGINSFAKALVTTSSIAEVSLDWPHRLSKAENIDQSQRFLEKQKTRKSSKSYVFWETCVHAKQRAFTPFHAVSRRFTPVSRPLFSLLMMSRDIQIKCGAGLRRNTESHFWMGRTAAPALASISKSRFLL